MKDLVIEEPRLYQEFPGLQLHSELCDDATYAAATRSFVIVCTDAIIYDRADRTVYLARRVAKPAMSLAWVIGGRVKMGERRLDAMHRHFLDDTGLDVSPSRFRFLQMSEYMWKDRRQEPQDVGTHHLAYTHGIELSPEERRYANRCLRPEEYEKALGLRRYTYRDLVDEGTHPVIQDLYRKLFD